MKVRVFPNRARRCLSIKAKFTEGWRVVAHTQHVELRDATALVSDARVKYQSKTGKKTDHTCIEGELSGWYINHGFSGIRPCGVMFEPIENAAMCFPLPSEPRNLLRSKMEQTGGVSLNKEKVAHMFGNVTITRKGVYAGAVTLAA